MLVPITVGHYHYTTFPYNRHHALPATTFAAHLLALTTDPAICGLCHTCPSCCTTLPYCSVLSVLLLVYYIITLDMDGFYGLQFLIVSAINTGFVPCVCHAITTCDSLPATFSPVLPFLFLVPAIPYWDQTGSHRCPSY